MRRRQPADSHDADEDGEQDGKDFAGAPVFFRKPGWQHQHQRTMRGMSGRKGMGAGEEVWHIPRGKAVERADGDKLTQAKPAPEHLEPDTEKKISKAAASVKTAGRNSRFLIF